ncbi:MAG: hypothetical protein ACR2IV_20335 [Bryobacteraceae bacterium]
MAARSVFRTDLGDSTTWYAQQQASGFYMELIMLYVTAHVGTYGAFIGSLLLVEDADAIGPV